jgi:hypothetical protein
LDFKVDENLPAEIAQLLNAAGHSAAWSCPVLVDR